MMPLYPNSSLVNDTVIMDLPQVKGIEGAKSYLTKPNCRDVVWDTDSDYFYIRVTNHQGQIISIDRYSFKLDPIPTMEDLFVSKDDFGQLKGELSSVKQSIQELISALGGTTTAASTTETKSDVKSEPAGKANGNSGSNKTKS